MGFLYVALAIGPMGVMSPVTAAASRVRLYSASIDGSASVTANGGMIKDAVGDINGYISHEIIKIKIYFKHNHNKNMNCDC